MESVINVENFYFAYKKSDLVLRDINFEIKKRQLHRYHRTERCRQDNAVQGYDRYRPLLHGRTLQRRC